MKRLFLYALAGGALASCTLGPDYKRPEADAPAAYKETPRTQIDQKGYGPWKPANPQEALPKGNWWELFNDPALNDLQKQARAGNQQAKAAYARVKEARAIADISRSAFFPVLNLDASNDHSQQSRNRPLPPPAVPTRFISSDYNLLFDADYDLDVWGRLGRLFESARAQAEAQQAQYENTLLVLQANVAQQYYTVRAYDAELEALNFAVTLRTKELDLVTKRFEGKIASAIDVAQAQTILYSTQSNLLATERSRADSEHALAVLLGKAPRAFSLPHSPLSDKAPPAVPAGLPSALLERRPDIAAAEREVVARNAEIGAAIGAFFPAISLTATGGLNSAELHNLFSPQSIAWAVVPGITQPIFNGGLNEAQLKEARAAYQESVALYRQQILTAFQQVEDALSDIRLLGLQFDVQARTVAAAQTTLHLSQVRYRTGVDTYLNVADAEVNDLQSKLTLIEVQRQRYLASAGLILALGGGWQ